MKASELIYRLARAIEQNGDNEVNMALDDNKYKLHERVEVKCLDVREDGTFEFYGEVQ